MFIQSVRTHQPATITLSIWAAKEKTLEKTQPWKMASDVLPPPFNFTSFPLPWPFLSLDFCNPAHISPLGIVSISFSQTWCYCHLVPFFS